MKMINYGLDILKIKTRGTQSYIRAALYPDTFTRSYNKNKIFLGYDLDDPTEEVTMNMTKTNHFLISGSTGSGKSWLTGRIMTIAMKSNGYQCFVPTDVKPEHYLLNKSLQSKFHKYLGTHETCDGIKTRMLYPYFLSKMTGKVYKEATLIQLAFTDITVQEFLGLLDYESLTTTQRDRLPGLFKTAQKDGVSSFTEFLEFMKLQTDGDDKDLNKATYNSLKHKIQQLLDMGIIGSEHCEFDIIDDINNGIMPTLNLYGWASLRRNIRLPAIFVSLLLRRIMDAKARRKIKHDLKLIELIEEAPLFIPNDAAMSHPSKYQIQNQINLCRQYRIAMGFCTQKIKLIPNDIVTQCRYIFIPQNVQLSEAKELYKSIGSYTTPYNFNSFVTDKIKKLRAYKAGHAWKMIDTQKYDDLGDVWERNFVPLAPLGFHRDE